MNTTKEKNVPRLMLMSLKMKGRQTVVQLAKEFKMTSEGARLHLVKLAHKGLVAAQSESTGVGRPKVFYELTDLAQNQFPNTHADLTVQLIESVGAVLGAEALDKLIADRENRAYERYLDAVRSAEHIEDKLKVLTQIRTEEGYMASWTKGEADAYYFVENHCPICAAARACQGFCRAELNNFKSIFGANFQTIRTEHILDDSKRCVYKITPIPASDKV